MKNYLSRTIRYISHSLNISFINMICKNITIGNHFRYRKRLELNCDSEGKIEIGDNVFFNNDCSVNSHNIIRIGDNCIFGENVKIYDHNHRFALKDKLIRDQGYSSKKILIGEDCWIGSNVIILAGSIIGKHCVIGAGSIISSNVPDYSIVRSNRNNTIEPIR